MDDFTCVPAAPCRAGRLYWRPSELSATPLCHQQYLPQQDCATPDCLPSACFRLNTNLCKWLWGDCARRIHLEISSSWSNEGLKVMVKARVMPKALVQCSYESYFRCFSWQGWLRLVVPIIMGKICTLHGLIFLCKRFSLLAGNLARRKLPITTR